MQKVIKGTGGQINLWALNQKISGLTFVNPKTHTYYTQCQLQMAVTNLEKLYFVVRKRHGMIIDTVTFDKELWDEMKNKFILYYENFYLKTFFVK